MAENKNTVDANFLQTMPVCVCVCAPPEMTSSSSMSLRPFRKSSSMFSICVPAFLKWELHQAVKVWKKNSRLEEKLPVCTCTREQLSPKTSFIQFFQRFTTGCLLHVSHETSSYRQVWCKRSLWIKFCHVLHFAVSSNKPIFRFRWDWMHKGLNAVVDGKGTQLLGACFQPLWEPA